MIALEGDLFLVIHLMVTGRLRWKERGAAIPRKLGHAALDCETGTLLLTEEAGGRFPDKLAAFHPRMAAHGKFRQPCPRCRSPIQRIVCAETETNCCARCQTGGRLLADRARSRILREDWPRSLNEPDEPA